MSSCLKMTIVYCPDPCPGCVDWDVTSDTIMSPRALSVSRITVTYLAPVMAISVVVAMSLLPVAQSFTDHVPILRTNICIYSPIMTLVVKTFYCSPTDTCMYRSLLN